MARDRRLQVSVFAATLLLAVATVGLASVPPRPLRSALTVVHTLSFRVATDWLAVVALLAVAERYVRVDRDLSRRTVVRLTAAVALGGLAIEASPFVRLAIDPGPVEAAELAGGIAGAIQRTLFPTGLFVATTLGAVTLRDAVVAVGGEDGGRLPLAPTGGRVPNLVPRALAGIVLPLAVVAAGAFALEVGVRLAVGDPYPWLAVVDAGTGALAGLTDHAVVATAFLVLAVEGAHLRSVALGAAAVWVALFATGIVVAVLSAGLSVVLVGLTTTPMGAVEGAALGRWPAPASWELLLQTGTYLAGAVGLWAVQRTTGRRRRRDSPTEAGIAAGDTGQTR